MRYMFKEKIIFWMTPGEVTAYEPVDGNTGEVLQTRIGF